MQGKHLSTTDTPSRWRRKLLGIPLAWWAAVTATGTALAVVGYIIVLGNDGSISAADPIEIEYGDGPTATVLAGNPTCTVTDTSGDVNTITISNAIPGDQCRFTFGFYNMRSDGTTAVLQSYEALSDAYTSGSFTAELGAGDCGKTMPAWNGDTNGRDVGFNGAQVASVTITATESMVPGASYTLDPTLDGFRWVVPNAYDAGLCTP